MNGFWNIVLFAFWAFAFVAYLVVLFSIIVDLFRDDSLNGWWKALWLIFLVFMPFLTALVYLIARGRGMSEREVRQRVRVPEDDDYYSQPMPSATPSDDIQRAKQLRDEGVISDNEYGALKAKALGQRF